MVTFILENISVNLGLLFIFELMEFKVQNKPTLMFPSLITQLCRWDKVVSPWEIIGLDQ